MSSSDHHLSRRVYIGSSFSLKDRVQRLYEALQDHGHLVPDVWWDESREQADLKVMDIPDSEWYDHRTIQARADRHFSTIEGCDSFVIVCPSDGQTKKFNGANVELGYAIANGLRCYSLGMLERSAMYEPVTQTDSIGELLEEFQQVTEVFADGA